MLVDIATGSLNGQGVSDISGINNLSANSKSFDIEHPIKGKPWRLRYGVLEGPEHGVYFRGQTTENIIELPDYWNGLVHENSYTVNLTPIGKPIQHFVVKIENHKIYIDSENGEVNTFYYIVAERKDVPKVLLEYKPTKE
jgi:light-regulated signal transduction histidine kinase (bacteriophytochrome)